MSDIAKWALLAAGIVILIGLVLALPFMDFIDFGQFGSAVGTIVNVAGSAFSSARGFINNLFSPFGRTVLSGLMYYLLGRYFITVTIKLTSWVYHFIFK